MDKGDVIRSRILRVCLFLETECPCSLRLVYLLPSLWTEYFTMPANMPNHKLNPGKKKSFQPVYDRMFYDAINMAV